MECTCKVQSDLIHENVEQILQRTLFGCPKTWLVFLIRKISLCFEGKRAATSEEGTVKMDDGGEGVHSSQEGDKKLQ